MDRFCHIQNAITFKIPECDTPKEDMQLYGWYRRKRDVFVFMDFKLYRIPVSIKWHNINGDYALLDLIKENIKIPIYDKIEIPHNKENKNKTFIFDLTVSHEPFKSIQIDSFKFIEYYQFEYIKKVRSWGPIDQIYYEIINRLIEPFKKKIDACTTDNLDRILLKIENEKPLTETQLNTLFINILKKTATK